jgi:hypothetical protein
VAHCVESDALLLKHRDKIVIAAFDKDVDVQPSALSSTMVSRAFSHVILSLFSCVSLFASLISFSFPPKQPTCNSQRVVHGPARVLIGLLQVRRYVAAGRSIKYFVADEVLRIIEKENLFKDGDQQSSSY